MPLAVTASFPSGECVTLLLLLLLHYRLEGMRVVYLLLLLKSLAVSM